APPQPRFYEVQPGDTLFDIAKAHGLPVEAIMQANGMTDANVLLAGQVIQLPLAPEFTPSTPPPVASLSLQSAASSRLATPTSRCPNPSTWRSSTWTGRAVATPTSR